MQPTADAAYLITGASRGLGAALARTFDEQGASMFLVARGSLDDGFVDARIHHADLSDPATIPVLLESFDEFLRSHSLNRVTLVNNAGTVAPIKPAQDCGIDQVDAAIRLNLLAPMALTGGFIRLLADRALEKRVVNISSGAASTPYAGWSTYCAGKAGLDHFTRCVGLEQQDARHPTTVIALAPGVVDTDMQGAIRESSAQEFPMIDRFLELKASGSIPTPAAVARKIAHFLESHPLEHGGVYDVRDLQP